MAEKKPHKKPSYNTWPGLITQDQIKRVIDWAKPRLSFSDSIDGLRERYQHYDARSFGNQKYRALSGS